MPEVCFGGVDLGLSQQPALLLAEHGRVMRMSRPSRRAALLGIGRVIPAALAAFELRYLLASLGQAQAGLEWAARAYAHADGLWGVALVAVCAVLMLRELGRGLFGCAFRRRWSASLMGVWLLCSSAFVVLFLLEATFSGSLAGGHPVGVVNAVLGPAGWSSLPAALCVGLVLAASFKRAWLVLREVARMWARRTPDRRSTAAAGLVELVARPTAVPLLVGWSDRGPPTDPLPAAV